MIKNVDTFEANLVMSTLSPEDEEIEGQRCRSLVKVNSQNANVDIEPMNGDDDKHLIQEDEQSDCNSSSSRKRNLSNATDFGNSRHVALDILRKKRRTSVETRRDTRMPTMIDINSSIQPMETNPMENLPSEIRDLDSDNVEVIFQDESPPLDIFAQKNDSENSEIEAISDIQINQRDHRPFVRQVFKRCFTGNSPHSLINDTILAEASDEE